MGRNLEAAPTRHHKDIERAARSPGLPHSGLQSVADANELGKQPLPFPSSGRLQASLTSANSESSSRHALRLKRMYSPWLTIGRDLLNYIQPRLSIAARAKQPSGRQPGRAGVVLGAAPCHRLHAARAGEGPGSASEPLCALSTRPGARRQPAASSERKNHA
jgi:hypothetical protein